jgi:hypothetical protein
VRPFGLLGNTLALLSGESLSISRRDTPAVGISTRVRDSRDTNLTLQRGGELLRRGLNMASQGGQYRETVK